MIVKSVFGGSRPKRSEYFEFPAMRVWELILNTLRFRIRSANILLITFKALANEIAKNLVLAGIGTLTIVDHETVKEEDLGAQFFISEEHIGQNVCCQYRWKFQARQHKS